MFQVDYMPILINRDNQTGLSFISGKPVTGLNDLPLFRVEVRKFRTDDHAQAFVEGLEAAGAMNKITFDWEEGDSNNNRLVLVGYLQDEVSADTPIDERLTLIDFKPSNRDHRARERFHVKDQEDRRRSNEKMQNEAQAMFSPLEKLGFAKERVSHGGVSAKAPDGYSVDIHFGFNVDGIEVSTRPECTTFGMLDLKAEYRAYVEGTTCSFRDSLLDCLQITGLTSPDEIPDAVERLRLVEQGLEKIKKDAHWNDFVSRTPLNKARREFLEGARDGSIYGYVKRANKRARAGGRDIGMSEIDVLLRRGWIEGHHPNLSISQLGIDELSDNSAKPRP